jgi:hypothetical protein
MSMNARLWSWRRAALVTGLSLVAAFAGYQSELKAGSSVTKFTFKGDFVHAEWDGFSTIPNTSSGAWAEAENGVNGPGPPQPAGFATIVSEIDFSYPDGTFLWTEVFGSSSGLPQDIVSAKVTGNGGTGSLNFTLPAGTTTLWTYDGTNETTVPVMASANASVSGTATDSFQSRTTSRDKFLGSRVTNTSKGQEVDPSTASGSGGIAVTDAMGNPLPDYSIPNGTATNWNQIEEVSSGSMTIIKP